MEYYFYSFIVGIFLFNFSLVYSQEVERPTFPDVFESEIEGVFLDELSEVDGSMFYDRTNNRAALFYTYENENTKTIYNFEDNQFIYIQGNECSVSEISDEVGATFFPFTTSDTSEKKILAKPEEILYFSKSVLESQELSTIPSYLYSAKMNFTQYKRSNCDVLHIFSKPEMELSDCDGHACKPTLMSISIKCPSTGEDDEGVHHVYNFYRFRSGVRDPSVFQPPPGLHCDITSRKQFPNFSLYYSFSYDIVDEVTSTEGKEGAYSIHKKVWYDSKLKLVRLDEFDQDDLMISSRIFDFYGKTGYSIVATLSQCSVGAITEEDVPLDRMTRLPNVFFNKEMISQETVIYIGKRLVGGIHYDVWTSSSTDPETEAKYVQEYHFIKNMNQDVTPLGSKWLLSHLDIYIYEKSTSAWDLTGTTHLKINDFRSKPKEWEAFDVSPCFNHTQRKWFRLKVTGPPLVKGTYSYEDILERLYMRLIITTTVSVIRINELSGTFDGVNIIDFTGWLLNTPQILDSSVINKEPDMNEAFKLMQKAATEGKLDIKLKKGGGKDLLYKITSVETEKKDNKPITTSGYSIDTLAETGFTLLLVGVAFGVASYHFYLRRNRSLSIDRMQLTQADLKSI